MADDPAALGYENLEDGHEEAVSEMHRLWHVHGIARCLGARDDAHCIFLCIGRGRGI